MRAVSMENSDRWAMVSTQYQLPTPLPRHSTAIRFNRGGRGVRREFWGRNLKV